MKKKRGIAAREGEEDLEKGNLFATGLVAGGSLLGSGMFALLHIPDKINDFLKRLSLENWLTSNLSLAGYYLLGVGFFAVMGYALYRAGVQRGPAIEE